MLPPGVAERFSFQEPESSSSVAIDGIPKGPENEDAYQETCAQQAWFDGKAQGR
jgi:hypothetical protein